MRASRGVTFFGPLSGSDQYHRRRRRGTPSLLLWVGALQPAPFEPEQLEAFREIVPALRARLVLELGGRASGSLAILSGRTVEGRLAIQAARAGERWGLTSKEREILGLLVRGCSNRTIGDVLGIECGCVEFHVSRIFDRAGVANRDALCRCSCVGNSSEGSAFAPSAGHRGAVLSRAEFFRLVFPH